MKQYKIIGLLLLFAIFLNYNLVFNGINASVDMPLHVGWLQHFSKQIIEEGIVYPRWLAGTNYGYGSPSFVFYPPLVYYLGTLLKVIKFNTEQSVIIICILSSFSIGLSFYLFSRNHCHKIASLIGAFVYMTSPYIAINIYRRGALPETFSLIFIPLCMWSTDKALSNRKYQIYLSIIAFLLAITHVPSLLLISIVWAIYSFYLLVVKENKLRLFFIQSIFILFGFISASFYLVPVFLESKFVNLSMMLDVSGGYANNFIYLLQKNQGQPQENIQEIAIISLVLIFLTTTIIFIASKKYKNNSLFYKNKSIINWLFSIILIICFMSSIFRIIWDYSPILQKIQFPWRIMGIFSFAVSGFYSQIVSILIDQKNKLLSNKLYAFSLILIFFVVVNQIYMYSQQTTKVATIHQLKGWKQRVPSLEVALNNPYNNNLLDVEEYRPLVNLSKPSPSPILGQKKVLVVDGVADIKINKWQSYQRQFEVQANTDSIIGIRTYYYPAWHLYINQKSYDIEQKKDGTMIFSLQPGKYNIELKYQKTKAFILGILISLISLIFLFVYYFLLRLSSK